MHMYRLRATLLAGAAYDLALGLAMVVALRPMSELLPIAYPLEPGYVRLCGVLVFGLGLFHGATALSLPGGAPCVYASIAVRALGGAFLVALPFVDSGVAAFLAVFGGIDLLLAFATFAARRADLAITRR